MKIAVVREIDRIQADANLVPAPALQERQVQMKIPINLRICGKESREARAIRQSYIILKRIHVGVGKAGVQVNNRTYRQRPREVEHSPTDHAIGHVRRQNARDVRTNHRLLEGKENAGYGIQVAAGSAPDVGNIQVGILKGPEMQRRLEFVIVRLASMEKAQQASTSEHARNGIHDEQVTSATVYVANANNCVDPQLPIDFDIPHETPTPIAGPPQ